MKKKELFVFSAFISLMAIICVAVFARENFKKEMHPPKSVMEAVKKAYPTADIQKIEVENLTIPAYEITLEENGKDTSVVLTDDGTVVSSESVITTDLLPEKVASLISEKVKDAKILKTEKENRYAGAKLIKFQDTQTSYEVKVARDDKEYEITSDGDGNLVSMKIVDEENDNEDND